MRSRIFAGVWKAGEKLPTDADLARMLGCSVGTIGKALGLLAHDGIVARKTKAGTRVLRNSCGTRGSDLDLDAFAFIYPSSLHEGISRTLHGFENAAREKGRRLVTLPTGVDFKKEVEIISRLDEFDVRAAAACPLISTPSDQLQISQLLLKTRIPVALLGLSLPGFSAAAIMLDNFRAAYDMTQHLLTRGCRRIGFLSNYSWIQFRRDRYAGYRRAMEEAGIAIASEWVHLANVMHADLLDPTHEPAAVARSYLAGKPQVEGVVCADDFMAVGLVRAASELGMSVPGDLMVTGIDDFEIAKAHRPELTTYRVPYEQMGQKAFELLQSNQCVTNDADDELRLTGKLIIRQST